MDNVTNSGEYQLLLREHKDLVAEHERLESTPYDHEAHVDHRQRLITHNKRLHDFIVAHFTGPKPAAQKPDKGKRPRPAGAVKTKKSPRARGRR